MNLNNLPKTTTRSRKIVGRGYGSGKGEHTTGRGAKGANVRGSTPLSFTGTKTKKSLIKRLPLLRGKGKMKSLTPSPIVLNLNHLSVFTKGDLVNLESLAQKGLIDAYYAKRFGVKLLATGKLDKALKIDLPISKNVSQKVVQAGGEIITKK